MRQLDKEELQQHISDILAGCMYAFAEQQHEVVAKIMAAIEEANTATDEYNTKSVQS